MRKKYDPSGTVSRSEGLICRVNFFVLARAFGFGVLLLDQTSVACPSLSSRSCTRTFFHASTCTGSGVDA